ncbi:hypothetical protein [Actinomycetospora sp. CA-084318]|uniref:hypothetical protein n=1 Tax=Actinomycetospora sp. CA-084318 TaxID=3239892 RepID=UPI003D976A6F
MSERQFTMPASPAGIPGFTEWERALDDERGRTTLPPTPRPEEPAGFGRAVVSAALAFVLGLGVGTAVILGTGLAGPPGPGGPAGPAPAVQAGPAAPAPPA